MKTKIYNFPSGYNYIDCDVLFCRSDTTGRIYAVVGDANNLIYTVAIYDKKAKNDEVTKNTVDHHGVNFLELVIVTSNRNEFVKVVTEQIVRSRCEGDLGTHSIPIDHYNQEGFIQLHCTNKGYNIFPELAKRTTKHRKPRAQWTVEINIYSCELAKKDVMSLAGKIIDNINKIKNEHDFVLIDTEHKGVRTATNVVNNDKPEAVVFVPNFSLDQNMKRLIELIDENDSLVSLDIAKFLNNTLANYIDTIIM